MNRWTPLYPAALQSDSIKSVFKGQENEFYKAYVSLIQSLSRHLKASGFSWTKKVRCFNRIYFSPEGRIDYFLFHFPDKEVTKVQEKSFNELVTVFIL